MIARALSLALVLSLFVTACAGASAPPQTPAGETPPPVKAPESAAPAQKSLAEMQHEFMEACSGKVPGAPEYCDCGWEQMAKTFTLEEMNASGEDPAKMTQLRERVEATCKSKLPEEFIRHVFTRTCDGGMPKLTPYCDCNWTELRKGLSPGELIDDGIVKTERFTSAKRDVVKVCGAKMPEDIARQAFLTACGQDPKLEGFCECAWKQIRTEKSAAEVEAGFVDMDALQPKVEKSCSKLRPKK